MTKIIEAHEITTHDVLIDGKGRVAFIREIKRTERLTLIRLSGQREFTGMVNSRKLRVQA